MGSPAVLDVAALLKPIPGPNPAGADVALTDWTKLNEDRKEFQPHPTNPAADPVPRKVNWDALIEFISKKLTQTSKDLRLAVRLPEALVKRYGFAGLRDGLALLRTLVADAWDRLFPEEPETEEGREARAGAFYWLNANDSGALFPNTVRSIPLLQVGSQKYTTLDYFLAIRGSATISADDLPRLSLVSAAAGDDVVECVANFHALQQALDEKLGSDAPGLSELGGALEECRQIVEQFRPAASDAEPVTEGSGDGQAVTGAVPTARGAMSVGAATREQAYDLIGQAAERLAVLEPHSPIPDLLRRAVALGRLPFRELIRELVRDNGSLQQIRREFGLGKSEESD